MTLAAAMSAVCPSSEVDELTICLLTIFEHRGLSFELLETLIKQEIEETGGHPIFRSENPVWHVD
jgi:neurofibromin 1